MVRRRETQTYDSRDDGAGADADDVVEEVVDAAAREPLQMAQHLDGDEPADAAAIQRQHAGPRPARRRAVPHQRESLHHTTMHVRTRLTA